MNCKTIEPFLSLYVGRDLEEDHSRLVAAHLQSCSTCTLAADEYARASQLLKGYEPPLFSDEIYAGIREQVLNKIERESHALVRRPGIFSQLFLASVQPRMRWVTAALLLAISVTALYFSRADHLNKPQIAQMRTDYPSSISGDLRPYVDKVSTFVGSSSFSNKGQVRITTTRGPITRKRKANPGVVATNRSRELDKTTKVDSSTNDRVVQPVVDVSQPSSAPAPLRVEMQTSDRNIRIIWLSGQRPGAGGRDGSKGI
jgi:hypothetical protein